MLHDSSDVLCICALTRCSLSEGIRRGLDERLCGSTTWVVVSEQLPAGKALCANFPVVSPYRVRYLRIYSRNFYNAYAHNA